MARPKGTVKFKYAKEQAERVHRLAMIGCNDDMIASIEKMSEATLKNLYAKELRTGRAKGVGAISQTAYQMALSGKNPAMTMFFLKCRGRWKEVHQIDHSGGVDVKVSTHAAIVKMLGGEEKTEDEGEL